jgi:signal peptidase I
MATKWQAWLVKFWREIGRPFLVILVVVGSFRSAVADWNDVPTPSMNPTILEGDRIFVNKLAYDLRVPFTDWRIAQWSGPQRGEVVILFSPADDTRLVKRVVGVPGDRIAMRNNRLFVNGEPALYGPIDPEVIAHLDDERLRQYRFAGERIDDETHPIMIAPSSPAWSSFAPLTVPADQYFVMGDNRDNSRDSRSFGCVDARRIVGRATAVVLSVDPDRYYLPRWHRFFSPLP